MSTKIKEQSDLPDYLVWFNQKPQGHFDMDYSKYEQFNKNLSMVLKYNVKRAIANIGP